LFMWEWTVAD